MHLFMHVVARTAYQRNPIFYAVAHRDVWAARVFEYFERSLDHKEAQKRKRF